MKIRKGKKRKEWKEEMKEGRKGMILRREVSRMTIECKIGRGNERTKKGRKRMILRSFESDEGV